MADEPRPGRPATIGIDRVEQVIIDTLESLYACDTLATGEHGREVRPVEIHDRQI